MKLKFTASNFKSILKAMSAFKAKDGEMYQIEIKKLSDKRTLTQNACLHEWCENVGEALNDAGYDMRTFFKYEYPLPFTKYIVKDHIWRPVQIAVTGKESTTEPKAGEYSVIFEHVNYALSERGIYVPWPDQFTKSLK